MLEKLPALKLIVRAGVGYDNVDLAAAALRGIRVCNVPDYGTEEVADHALALLLALARKVCTLATAVNAGRFPTLECSGSMRLRGKTIGIVGFGRIGKALCVRAQAVGLKVLFYDPYVVDGLDKVFGVTRMETLEEMVPLCDILTLHCNLTEETRGMIDHRVLGLARTGLMLINTGRGELVVTPALVAALDSGRLASAGLDVVDPHPHDPEESICIALRNRPNVVVTPHTAFYSDEAIIELRSKACLEIVRLLSGKPLRNVVNGRVV